MSEAPDKFAQLADRLRNVRISARQELEVSRHMFQGEPSYVLHDPITFQAHQLSPKDYQILVALNADRPLGENFDQLVEKGRLSKDRETDFYKFVVHLNQLGLLNLPVSDGEGLYQRFAKKRASRLRSKITGILFLRVPLINPDTLLNKTMHYFTPLFNRTALAVWSVCLAISTLVILARWEEFCSPLGSMLALQNLPVLWTLLVVLKVAHEFGHAYACKHFGGRVPEMGAFFILFTPCAYVDASAAWNFRSRLHRIIVSLGGMYFESILAMVALLIWCFTDPGVIHSAAQYAVVLSTVVTIGFNINPLMRYDGYYILSDLIGVPNLRSQATRQFQAGIKRVLLGIKSPSVARSTIGRIGLTTFGFMSACYKVVVVIGIVALIALKIPSLGLWVAAYFLGSTLWQLGRPLVHYLFWSDEVASVKFRAVGAGGLVALVAGGILFALPVPGSVEMSGIVARRDDRIVRAEGSGFLAIPELESGEEVQAGTLLCRLENFEVKTAVRRKQAEINHLRIQLHRDATQQPLSAAATLNRMNQALQELQQLQAELKHLTVESPIDGLVVEANGLKDSDRFVRKGDQIATVSAGPWVVDAVATQQTVSAALPKVNDKVQIRLLGHGGRAFHGKVIQLARAGSRTVVAESLTQLGGGSITVAPATMEAIEPLFNIQIELDDADTEVMRHGMTALAVLSSQRVSFGTHLYRRVLNFLNRLRAAG